MMDETERWIYFGGPEPSHLKPLFDALRDLPPLTEADKEHLSHNIMKRIDEATSRRAESSASGNGPSHRSSIGEGGPISGERPRSAPDTDRAYSQEGPTARSPSFDEYIHARPVPAPKLGSPGRWRCFPSWGIRWAQGSSLSLA